MSESADYSPGIWQHHDFDKARMDYRSHAATSFDAAVRNKVSRNDLVPSHITTSSTSPVVIITDQTGSMHDWPATFFSKFPYLEHEAKSEYQGPDVEFSWAAFGDAYHNERYPLQVRPFAVGTESNDRIKELVHEGQGGGSTQETSELAALYYARNVKMPNAINPLLVFISDESPYDKIDPSVSQIAHVKLQSSISTKTVFEELLQRFAVYLIQKPYGSSTFSDGALEGITKRVNEDWARLIGEDHIALLADPVRVVDVIFGIMAREAGKIDYFKGELEGRQNTSQVETVYTSLKTVHALPGRNTSSKLLRSGNSVTRRTKSG